MIREYISRQRVLWIALGREILDATAKRLSSCSLLHEMSPKPEHPFAVKLLICFSV